MRLNRLSPGASKDISGMDLSDELTRMRTFKLPRLLPGTVTAELFVLLDPSSKINGIKLLKGPDKLKSNIEALGSAGPNLHLAEPTSARLLRWGIS